MRRAIVGLGLLAGFLCSAGVAVAQQACVLAPNGVVICGPIVEPNYAPPVEYYGPQPYYEGHRRGPPAPCPRGYTVQDGVCKPYTGR